MSDSAANPASPGAFQASDPLLAKVLLLLVSGSSLPAIMNAAQASLGLSAVDAAAAVAEARRLITLAAEWHRDEQLGTAITRLQHLFRENLSAGEYSECRQVQAQLNKLLGLYAPGAGGGEAAGDSAEQLATVRAHLQPLGLGTADTPLEELARLAAAEIIRLRGAAT